MNCRRNRQQSDDSNPNERRIIALPGCERAFGAQSDRQKHYSCHRASHGAKGFVNNHWQSDVRGQSRSRQDNRISGLIYLKAVKAIICSNRQALGIGNAGDLAVFINIRGVNR
jgi:hypothetical protein